MGEKSRSGLVLRKELKDREPTPRREVQFGPNSKPPLSLRLAATFIDVVIIFFAAFGLYSLFNITPLAKPVKNYRNEMILIQDATMLETGYGVKTVITPDNEKTYKDYLHHTDEGGVVYVVTRSENITQEIYTSYTNAMNNNQRYRTISFNYIFSNFGIVCLAIFIDELVFLFAIPLANKYRATVGQLFAGIQCINVRIENRARWYNLLGKFLFIFIIDSALPYLFLAEFTPLVSGSAILIWILFNNKTNRSLHDIISGSMLILKKTFTPMVQEQTFDEDSMDIEEEKKRIENIDKPVEPVEAQEEEKKI